MIYKYHFICTLLAVSLITSCAKKEDEEFSSVDAIASIEGAWSTGCDPETGVNATLNLTSSTSAVITVGYYYDSACSVIGYTTEIQQSYVLANWQTEEARQTGTIDWTYLTYTITPNTPQLATMMNNDSLCGFTNWTSGIPKSVLGLTCDGSSMPTFGTVDYDFIQYTLNSSLLDQGFTPGDLTFGLYDVNHDGTSPATRPVQSNPLSRLRR